MKQLFLFQSDLESTSDLEFPTGLAERIDLAWAQANGACRRWWWTPVDGRQPVGRDFHGTKTLFGAEAMFEARNRCDEGTCCLKPWALRTKFIA